MDHLIVFALPVFALLIGAEWLYGCWVKRNTYRWPDSLASLSQGLLSQAVAACTQVFQIGLYTVVFHHLAWRTVALSWDSVAGWIAAIVLFDFCDYWLHRAGHRVAVLWAAHVVHHQSEEFNFSTALRQESLVAVLGWPFYLPMALLGVPPLQFALAGLVVLVYQFWIHTEHIGKLGWFDRVFSSPSNHRVHHAVNPIYIDKNFGGMLVIWDRWFGTFALESEPCVYGTHTPLASLNPFAAVAQVYGTLARDAWHTRRWRDKCRIWFMPTGWRPADVAERFPASASRLDRTARFEPDVSRSAQAFAAAVFAAALAATAWLLWRADDGLGPLRTALAAAAIAGLLWSMGQAMHLRAGLVRMALVDAACIGVLGLTLV